MCHPTTHPSADSLSSIGFIQPNTSNNPPWSEYQIARVCGLTASKLLTYLRISFLSGCKSMTTSHDLARTMKGRIATTITFNEFNAQTVQTARVAAIPAPVFRPSVMTGACSIAAMCPRYHRALRRRRCPLQHQRFIVLHPPKLRTMRQRLTWLHG